ncbi:phage tail tape measure protein [Streptomyces sp. NPDC048825]|uniref:phage tail tape measure protein n=1 Tax=Streptomyces sp. NPDC048825 TaxID=3365592 RepID=UPI0037181E59
MASAYNLYVNLIANYGALTSGLRQSAGQLRSFDGQLAAVGNRMGTVQAATQRLARAQAEASAQMVRSQSQVTRATQQAAQAQQQVTRIQRAQQLATTLTARAQTAQATATTSAAAAQATAARTAAAAQAAQARGAANAGQLAERAARAQAIADRYAQGTAASQLRAASAAGAATRANQLAARASTGLADAESRARSAVAMRDEAQRTAARTAQASAARVARAQGEVITAMNTRAKSLAQTGLVLGAALGVGVAEAIALERAMANVMTISQQITGDNIAVFTDQIVELSTQLPQTAEQLADGLYQIVSTGFDGAEAMDILQVAAQGAAAGLTTTETSARALLGVLKAYGLEAKDASDVMDVMFQTVNLGVISYEELAQQLGDVVPMAAAAGVEFDDLSSALAAITLAGIPAAESATALNMLMTRLMKPTKELRQEIRGLGYESTASAVEQDGLYVVVNKLNRAAGGTAENLANMWRDIRATRAALALAAADGANYADTYAGIANEVERAGATQKAYAIQMDTTAGQWQLFANQARALGIDLGRALLPALKEIGGALNVFAGAINDLPGSVKSFAGALLAVSVASLLVGAGITKVNAQLLAFRTALAATRAGGAVMPTAMAGAGLAVSGLTALLAVGTIGYAAYTASKQQAKQATEELVSALKSEREEGESGAGLRTLTEQLTNSDDAGKLKQVGVDIEDAIDAVTSGGRKLSELRRRIRNEGSFAVTDPSGSLGYAVSVEAEDAVEVLDKQHKVWSGAVKKEAELARQMDIIESKIKQSRAGIAAAWNLDMMLPLDKNGAPQYTKEMEALAKAVGDVVDPARAFKDAQSEAAESMRKAGKSADDAKVSLRDYMRELREQAKAQRDFQNNLSELGLAGYSPLVDHFAELGVDAAPMLAELVKQLKKGRTQVADEMQGIVEEDARRSTEAYRVGLEQLPAIAAKYGEKTARAWARASETNDPAQFKAVTEQMALQDFGGAIRRSSRDARDEFARGMDLINQVARKRGRDAANALRDALLSGNVDKVMDELSATWGADKPIEGPDLSRVVGAFKTAGSQANSEWSGMLSLIAAVAKTKGSEAATALTSALLSGDMGAVEAQLNAIGVSVQNIPGHKSVTVSVTANQPPPIVVPLFIKRQATSWDRDANGVPDLIQAPRAQANGSVLEFYANGGVRKEEHVAQIAPAGSMRIWAEQETGGEAYVPLAGSKRHRSKAIVGEVIRRFGGQVEWYADGGLTDWSYSTPELFSLSGIASDSRDKKDRFSLSKFAKILHKSVSVARRWRRDLDTVARRAGRDVADALAEMGEDGIDLTHKMATGSSKYVRAMAKDLEALAATAKVSLSSYTSQLKAAVKDQQTFEKNITKLAAMGYTDLARMLSEQGDQDAEDLAAQAVKSPKAAKNANTAAKSAGTTMSDEELADLVKIIGAIKSSKTGIHAVAEATEMDEDHIIDVASAGKSRIKSALGKKADKFLSDLAKANKHLAYANGGILTPGIYATSNGIVKFAEPETAGEAFVPLGADKRGSATAVLSDVAQRFGYVLTPKGVTGPARLVDAKPTNAVQVVVVREQPAALVGSMPVTVNGTADAKAADRVGTEIMRRLRNAQRGGRI